jgi:dTDP-4-dehydrorhamnose 3,5-epimerase
MKSNFVDSIDGVRILPVKSFPDERGRFIKFDSTFSFQDSFSSIALSFNPTKGTLRGMHFQTEPFAEEKLVACVQGSILDVIIDLRPDSRTLGKWTSIEVSAREMTQIYIPKGLAHGFQTLEADSIVHYELSSTYSEEYSFAINPLEGININWPLKPVLVSVKDSNGMDISSAKDRYAESIKN